MAWDTELPPIEYLLKREKYYRKAAVKYVKWIKNPELLEKYTENKPDRWKEVYSYENVLKARNNCLARADSFKQAAYILSIHYL